MSKEVQLNTNTDLCHCRARGCKRGPADMVGSSACPQKTSLPAGRGTGRQTTAGEGAFLPHLTLFPQAWS